MVTSLPLAILVGIALGILTGLGTGGGSLLILWLTLICHMEPTQAKIINLMFLIPSSLTATSLRASQGHIPWKKLILPVLVGCISAGLFAQFSQKMNIPLLQKLFGLLLIYIGIKEIFYKVKAGADMQS